MSQSLRSAIPLLLAVTLGPPGLDAQDIDPGPALGAFLGTHSSDGTMVLVGGDVAVPLGHQVSATASLTGNLSSGNLLIAAVLLRYRLASSGIQPYLGVGLDWSRITGRSELGGAAAVGIEFPMPWVATNQATGLFSFFAEGHLRTTGYASVRGIAGIRVGLG